MMADGRSDGSSQRAVIEGASELPFLKKPNDDAEKSGRAPAN